MPEAFRTGVRRYGLACLFTALAMLLRLPLWPLLGDSSPYVTCIPAVMAAGYWGGLGPGLLATFLSALAGTFFLVEPRYSLLFNNLSDASGQVVFLLGGAFMSWLNESLHRARRRAEDSEARLRVAFRSIGDAVIVTDDAGRVRFLNPVAQQLTGWSHDEARGKLLGEVFPIFHEDTGSPVDALLERTHRGASRSSPTGHLMLRSRDGELHPIDECAAQIRDEQGQSRGMVLVFRDVGERLKAVQALQRAQARTAESLAQLDSLLAHAPIGFACFDRLRRATRVNHYLANLHGADPMDLRGQLVHRVLPFDTALSRQLLDSVLKTGQEVLGREISTGALGQERHWLASFYPVREAGKGRGVRPVELVAALLVEITDRKRLEAQLRRHADEMAEADRRKDLFLATLGHELRNPLAPIRAACEALLRSEADPFAVASLVGIIQRQTELLTRLVGDLLDTARIGQGVIELRREDVDLASLATEAVEAARPLLDERQHHLTVRLPAEAVHFRADPVRLRQVVGNLLTNAAKYTPPGGNIELVAERSGDSVVVRVRDNGLGIRPEILPRIFEPFHRGDRVPEAKVEGMGLGLTLVKGLVELHGGCVTASSAGPGEGSTFEVRLPLVPAHGTPQPRPTPRPSAQGTTFVSTQTGLRILVVDDNTDAAHSLSLVLRFRGHEVEVAHDGVMALEVAGRFRPDVVFLDIGLPGGLDGHEVARLLRVQPGLADVRLIALTGFGTAEDRQRSQEAGFEAHLVKPVGPEELAEVLARTGS